MAYVADKKAACVIMTDVRFCSEGKVCEWCSCGEVMLFAATDWLVSFAGANN